VASKGIKPAIKRQTMAEVEITVWPFRSGLKEWVGCPGRAAGAQL
jgi:hypothetical protein